MPEVIIPDPNTLATPSASGAMSAPDKVVANAVANAATVVGNAIQRLVIDNSAAGVGDPPALLVRGALRAPGHPEGGHYEWYIGGGAFPGLWTNASVQFLSWPASADGAQQTMQIHGAEVAPAVAIETDTPDAQIICKRGASSVGSFQAFDNNASFAEPNEKQVVLFDWSGRAFLAGGAQLATSILPTTATGGFLGIPICKGVPTGVITTDDGTTAQLVYDCSGGHLYVCWPGIAGTNIALTKGVTYSDVPDFSYGTLTDGLIFQNGNTIVPGVEFSVGFHHSPGASHNYAATVDLGSAYTLGKVRAHFGGGNGGVNAPDPLVVSLSTDNITYTVADTITGLSIVGGAWVDMTFSPVSARYVRVLMGTPTTDSYIGIGEIEAYQSPTWKLLA